MAHNLPVKPSHMSPRLGGRIAVASLHASPRAFCHKVHATAAFHCPRFACRRHAASKCGSWKMNRHLVVRIYYWNCLCSANFSSHLGRRLWLRPGKTYLFGRTAAERESKTPLFNSHSANTWWIYSWSTVDIAQYHLAEASDHHHRCRPAHPGAQPREPPDSNHRRPGDEDRNLCQRQAVQGRKVCRRQGAIGRYYYG